MSGRKSPRDIPEVNYREQVDETLTPAERLAQELREEDFYDQEILFVPPDRSFEEVDEDDDDDLFKSSKKPVQEAKNRLQSKKKPVFTPPIKKGPVQSSAASASGKRCSSPSPMSRKLAASSSSMDRGFSPSSMSRMLAASSSSSRDRGSSPSSMSRNLAAVSSSRDRGSSPSSRKPATATSPGSPPSPDSLPSPKSRSRSPPRRSPRMLQRLQGLHWDAGTEQFSPDSDRGIGQHSSAQPAAEERSKKKERKKSAKEQKESSDWIFIIEVVVKKMQDTRQPFDCVKMKVVYDVLLDTGKIEAVGWSTNAVKDKATRSKKKVSHF